MAWWDPCLTRSRNASGDLVVRLGVPQVKRKGSAAHPAWYVHDRLVARLLNPTTLLIRVPLSRRDTLLVTYPTSFGVPPRFEAHHNVEAYLDRAEPTAIRTAIGAQVGAPPSWPKRAPKPRVGQPLSCANAMEAQGVRLRGRAPRTAAPRRSASDSR